MGIRIGILGTGQVAVVMINTINAMPDASCAAVASSSFEKAEKFAKEYAVEKAYASYEEMLKDNKVELIYIATPHSAHYENAKLALLYNKPFLCEKAFMVNAKQAKELIQLAREKKVFLAEAIWTRYMPLLTVMKECIEAGDIGIPKMLTANVGYDISSVDRITNPKLAGGGLLDVGIYPLNFAAMLFGTDISNINAACTYTDTGVDEQAGIVLEYKDGKMAVLNYSICTVSDKMGIVQGSKGHMIVHNINNYEKICIYNNKYELVKEIQRPEQITGFEYEVRACMEALAKGEIECPQMPHEESIKMLEIMDSLRDMWKIKYPFE